MEESSIHVYLFDKLRMKPVAGDVKDLSRRRESGHLIALLSYHAGKKSFSSADLRHIIYAGKAHAGDENHTIQVLLSDCRSLFEAALQGDDPYSLDPRFVTTDVSAFRSLVIGAREAPDLETRCERLHSAIHLYGQGLLPNRPEWLVRERERLAAEFLEAASLFVDSTLALAAALREQRRGPEAHKCLQAALVVMNGLEESALPAANRQHGLFRLHEADGNIQPIQAYAQRAAEQRQRVPDLLADYVERYCPVEHRRAVRFPRPLFPPEESPLVGRMAERQKIRTALGLPEGANAPAQNAPPEEIPRLVTLFGPPGAGKSRFARWLAERLFEWKWQVAYIPLSDIEESAQLPAHLAARLGLRLDNSEEILPQIARQLNAAASVEKLGTQGARVFLVLDEFERLLPQGADTVRWLLEQVPRLTCVVTSRRVLNSKGEIEGEKEFRIDPLLLGDAIKLFEQQASARSSPVDRKKFASEIAQICTDVDCLPLAVLWLASQAATRSPQQLLGDLRATPLPDRLHAAFAGSVRLLDEPARQHLARLTVFRGGWTEEAASCVCGQAHLSDSLKTLRESSLISAAAGEEAMRFQMLATAHAYGTLLLAEEGKEVCRGLSQRHAAYFRQLALAAKQGLAGAQQRLWMNRIKDDYANLRAALAFLQTTPGKEAAEQQMEMAGALWRFWDNSGDIQEGLHYLQQALARPEMEEGDPVRRSALTGLGNLAESQGDYVSARKAHAAAYALIAPEDHARRASALGNLGIIAERMGDYAFARRCHIESFVLRRRLARTDPSVRPFIGFALLNLGNVAQDEERFAFAQRLFRQSLKYMEAPEDIASALNNLGTALRDAGEIKKARRYLDESLRIRTEGKNVLEMAITLENLGLLDAMEGDLARARTRFMEALAIAHDHRDQEGLVTVFEELAGVDAREGRGERAAQLLGFSEFLRARIRLHRPPSERHRYEETVGRLNALLGAARVEAEREWGRRFTSDAAVALAREDMSDTSVALCPR